MMKRAALVLAVLATLSGRVEAAAVTFRGPGSAASCGTWLEERRKESDESVHLRSWALGYLSGAASWANSGDPLGRPAGDSNGIFYWLDNYCRAYPTQFFTEALDAFIEVHRDHIPRR